MKGKDLGRTPVLWASIQKNEKKNAKKKCPLWIKRTEFQRIGHPVRPRERARTLYAHTHVR